MQSCDVYLERRSRSFAAVALALVADVSSVSYEPFGARAIQTRRQAQALNAAATIVSSQNHGSPAICGSTEILAMCAIAMRPNTVPVTIRNAFICCTPNIQAQMVTDPCGRFN